MNKDEKKALYTVRWYVREKWGDPASRDEVLALLDNLIDPEAGPDVRPSVSEPGAKLLWCPFAETQFPRARSRGTYANGYPKGAIVHFTAGRRNGLANGLSDQVNNGFLYFLIDAEGNIGQNFSLDTWGYHAGASSYPGLPGTVSDDLVGIEVQCAGRLKKEGGVFKSWFNTIVPDADVRTVAANANQEAGSYEKYTTAQEESLTNLLVWLCRNNPEVFSIKFVLGHDEVSPGRKNDPGGALSMNMPDFRARLKTLV